MPVIPPTANLPYDSVGYALNTVRAKLGDRLDTIQIVTGKVLDFTDGFMQQATNSAYRILQDYLAGLGYQQLTAEVIIGQMPVVASQDPAVFTWLSWLGFFDGVQLWQQPALPQTFTHPLKIWERWSNINAQFTDPPMIKMLDGLPTWIKQPRIRVWEWREDTIWMPGSQMVEDLRIRYMRYLPDFQDVGTLRWYQQPVEIMRSSEALSWFVCAVLTQRDPVVSAGYMASGVGAANEIFNRDVRADLRVNIRRRPSSRRSAGSCW